MPQRAVIDGYTPHGKLTMQTYSDRVLTENLIGNALLKEAFLEVERDAQLLRRALYFCGLAFVVCLFVLAHLAMDLPALPLF